MQLTAACFVLQKFKDIFNWTRGKTLKSLWTVQNQKFIWDIFKSGVAVSAHRGEREAGSCSEGLIWQVRSCVCVCVHASMYVVNMHVFVFVCVLTHAPKVDVHFLLLTVERARFLKPCKSCPVELCSQVFNGHCFSMYTHSPDALCDSWMKSKCLFGGAAFKIFPFKMNAK